MNFYAHQDDARRKTGLLVFLFVLAVITLVAVANVLLAFLLGFLGNQESTQSYIQQSTITDSISLFVCVSIAIVMVIMLASLFKTAALARGGGRAVAEALGGREVNLNTVKSHKQRQLLNVVSEMAIASGTPMPPVYIMPEEGINAFAAGFTPDNAVIGITEGCLKSLNREELQGVIAHEFSHIVHGDMRINIRLMGVLFGILFLGIIGFWLIRATWFSRSKDSKGLALLGVGLIVIGYAGTFFGNIIKAAVSRQREFLADASAVQFTRNPHGIRNALRKIGSLTGSAIQSPNASEVSHMFFAQGITTAFARLMATHPPLEERIKRIDPQWGGDWEVKEAQENIKPKSAPPTKALRPGAAIGIAALAGAVEQVGSPQPAHVAYAEQTLSEFPKELLMIISEGFGATALIYALLAKGNEKEGQINYLKEKSNKGVAELVVQLNAITTNLATEKRLPLIELAMPALDQLSEQQALQFITNLQFLINADNKVDLFEWCIERMVVNHLSETLNPGNITKPNVTRFDQVKEPCIVLLSTVAHVGTKDSTQAQKAFKLGINKLSLDSELIPSTEIRLSDLDSALKKLKQLYPTRKKELLLALAECITADEKVTSEEAELLRAVSAVLQVPMSPILPAQ